MKRPDTRHPLTTSEVARLCDAPEFVAHYRQALVRMELWRSEEVLFEQFLDPSQPVLDLGCGAGRVAFGLWKRGFRKLEGIDISAGMIAAAREHAAISGRQIEFAVGDATALPHARASFGTVIFGFGGLMQIPGRSTRREALQEILRVLKPGGVFIFTTHDREMDEYREFWQREAGKGTLPGGLEFGDIYEEGPHGMVFVHIPDCCEIYEDLATTGWSEVQTWLRDEIADENDTVEDLTDPCRFWVARKPGTSQ